MVTASRQHAEPAAERSRSGLSTAAGSSISQRSHLAIAGAATVPLLVLPFLTVPGADNYMWAFLFLVPLVWAVLSARGALQLHPLHFALFAAAVILHDLGSLGWYSSGFLALSFDTYVHFYFAFAGALVLERAFRMRAGWRGGLKWIAVVLCVLGVGALHELIEWASTLALGAHGMFSNASDPLDTHKDLFNDLLGCLTALCVAGVVARVTATSPTARPDPAHSTGSPSNRGWNGSRSEAN